ncbi:MAG: zf-TFIIB domain-containing protein [Desulfobacterales bacterium]
MHCPKCHEAMKPLKIGDVEIDECRQCRGIWFDKGELAEAKDEVDPDLRWLDFGIWKQETRFHINDGLLKCPRCQENAMREINYQGPDVDFRFCPFCEGVWLNAGDFKKILDAPSEEAESKSASEYRIVHFSSSNRKSLQRPISPSLAKST